MEQYNHCVKCGEQKINGALECQNCGIIHAKAEATINKETVRESDQVEPEKETFPNKISFQYSDIDRNQTTRTVRSACTFNYDGRAYIYGRCELRNAQRTFRVDRIIGDITDTRTGEVIQANQVFKVDPPKEWEDEGTATRTNLPPQVNKLLTKCPVCGRDVSKNAESCPGCGEPISPTPKTSKTVVKKQGGCGSGCGVLILLIIILAAFGSIFDSTDKKSAPKKTKSAVSENPNCRWEIQCWGDRHNITASVACANQVDKLAKYSHKWTDGWLDIKFSHFRWHDKNVGTVTYISDKIQFQNGFGAWQNYSYECDYDPKNGTVLEVRAYQEKM